MIIIIWRVNPLTEGSLAGPCTENERDGGERFGALGPPAGCRSFVTEGCFDVAVRWMRWGMFRKGGSMETGKGRFRQGIFANL